MCGIAGIADPNLGRQAISELLRRMTDTIVHRGPDDAGYFAADRIGLGMRRLSIIDVAGGHQPIANEDGQIQVICNGEIYNHLDLRRQLTDRGHRFRTRSDVEVIAHLYEEKGVDCFCELYGMFAIAIWDARQQRLVLARDRLGKKPLFYHHDAHRFLFGSEIKALLAAAPELAQTDAQALVPYFRFGFVPQPHTMFENIHKLPAGSVGVWERKQLRIEPYWEVKFGADDSLSSDPREWVEQLDALLLDAVRIRLQSEVPLGVFLSGGLDSSAIVAYADRAGLRPLKTFTVGFDRQDWDESPDAQLVADRYGTEHHALQLTERDLTDHLPETLLNIVRHCDEPFGDPAALPTYHISQLARQHVTVILGGDGGDELFAGYTIFKGIKFAESYRRLPQWLGAGLLPAAARGFARVLPPRQRYQMLRVARVLRDSKYPPEFAYFAKSTRGHERSLETLLNAEHQPPPVSPDVLPFPPQINRILQSDLPVLSKLSHAHICFYLLDRYLVKVDRMSMAHSLEVRSPFLDHRVVEFAAKLPPSAKLRGWESKAILKDLVRPHLPARTLSKRKQGFGVPLRDWLRTGLSEMVGDYLESEHGGLPEETFNRNGVREIVRQHRRAEADHSGTIWLLLNYAAWHDLYFGYRKSISREASCAS